MKAKGEHIMATKLTKQDLQKLGVTDVHRDGTVYVHGTKKSPYPITTKHAYGENRTYLAVSLQDYTEKVPITHHYKRKDGTVHDHKTWAYRVRTVPLARLVLAWFRGEIPGDMDADHIDGDPMNNHIKNLQMISRRENLAKRSLSWSEISRLYWAKKKEADKDD